MPVEGFNYAVPPLTESPLRECSFYQTIDIPGLGVQIGQWDLRPNFSKYLGSIDFFGARVLEIGTANGFVCFEMERRGAHVVAFDLSDDMIYDAPAVSHECLARSVYLDGLRRIRNGYWLAHHRLGSKAQVAYGHANQLPAELGEFDIGVIANVLQHLQDPVGALMQLAKRSKAVVVTEADWLKGYCDDLNGMVYFEKDNPFVWFQVKPRLIESVLRKMGFTRFERSNHHQLFIEDAEHKPWKGPVGAKTGVGVPHFTIVAYDKHPA